MPDELCRSKSPEPDVHSEGYPCEKPRGHKKRWHSNQRAKKRWEGGINTAPRWEVIDDGYRTEGEYLAMRQMGVRW